MITVAVRRYLRYALSYRKELLAELVQNLRHYELATDAAPPLRL